MTEEFNQTQKNSTDAAEKQLSSVQNSQTGNKKFIIISIIVLIAIIALVVVASIFLLRPENSDVTEQLRDVFIIFMALESLIIGIALVVLIVQLATLINLLQNEIRPIINSTSETVNTLKGTAKFVSNNLTEPIIKVNQVAAMIKRAFKSSKR